eukprot:jgi/Mesvir1/12609/Mv06229-RA.1
MAKVSPGSRIINVEEHAGEDGRTYYMSRWTVDPEVPCIVCKKDRPHKSAGHGPRVCEYSDGRVTYSCWKKGPKHAECIMDRREFVAESVPFGETGIEEFVLDRESARTMTIPRDKAIEIGNRIDREIMGSQTFMRAVFGYQRRAKGAGGTLSFAQCSSLINTLLASTLNISAGGTRMYHMKEQDLEISKAGVLDFCERYQPGWWGNEAELASLRHQDETHGSMDEGYHFR